MWDAIQCNWHKKSCYAAARSEQVFVLQLSCCPVPLIHQSNSTDKASLPSQTSAFLPVFASSPTQTVVPPTTCIWLKTLSPGYTSVFSSSYSIWTLRLGICSSLSKILFLIMLLEPMYCVFIGFCLLEVTR